MLTRPPSLPLVQNLGWRRRLVGAVLVLLEHPLDGHPGDEERREVGLRHDRRDPVVRDLHGLEDQPGQGVALLRVRRPHVAGRSRKKDAWGSTPARSVANHGIAGKGYSDPAWSRPLRRRGIPHTIPELRDPRQRWALRPGRPLAFDAATYRRRNLVERCVNRLKQWRGIATRSEKQAAYFRAMVVVASVMIWLGQ